MTSAEAFIELLALPDEPCLHRGYRYTQPRSARVSPDILKRDLATAYCAHRMQDHKGNDISCVVSVRRQPLRLVRKA